MGMGTSVPEIADALSRFQSGLDARLDGSTRIPLVVTPQSLSRKTAIGTQTHLLMEGVPRWNHLFWDEAESRNFGAHSTRIESKLFGRIALFKRDPLPGAARLMGACGFSWWDSNRLKAVKANWLRSRYRDLTSVAFAAICSSRDGERARSVLEALDRPFLLHFWDLLDTNQVDVESTRWLVQNAAHVFCCSEPIREALRGLRSDTSILRPRRMSAAHIARPPGRTPLRIALIGYCSAYTNGMSLLNDALNLMHAKGIATEVRYIGNRKQMERWSHCLPGKVRPTGFLHSDDARDQALASCHVGFLPGPLASPDTNSRSRYSIPSRILDYLATGLPCVAMVHRESATAIYLNKIGLRACIVECSADNLAEQLSALANVHVWNEHATMSQQAFCTAQQEWGELAPWLERISAIDSPRE